MANNVDPDEKPHNDEMPHSAASHLGLHCLLRPVCPTTINPAGKDGKGSVDTVVVRRMNILQGRALC